MANHRRAIGVRFFLLLMSLAVLDVNCSDQASATSDAIPVIDILPWTKRENYSDLDRQAVAELVDKACRGIGFFAIKNHGVDEKVIDRAWSTAQAFFDLPLETKLKAKTDNDKEYPYGYENNEKLQLGKNKKSDSYNDTLADLKETFSIGPYNPASGQQAPRFPSQPTDMKASLSAYYRSLEDLAMMMLHIFAVALHLGDPTFFQNHMDHHISALRILNYPPVDGKDVRPGQLRASAHTDYGVFTVLKSGGPGLQIKKDTDDHDWIDAPNLEDTFIINIGDLMQRWTNDLWISTLHRVIVSPGEQKHERRQSVAFFVTVNGDSIVDPADICPNEEPKHPPITAERHLMTKFLASLGKTLDDEEGIKDEL